LKREIEPKIAKLERRTLRALVEMANEEEKRQFDEEGGIRD
jgi:coiled-coil domain-containing protein 12